MKNHTVTRLSALAALLFLLAAFATPVAAAPLGASGTPGIWGPGSFVDWLQSVWVAWFDGGDAEGPSGLDNLWGAHGSIAEPDGAKDQSPTRDTSDFWTVGGGSF